MKKNNTTAAGIEQPGVLNTAALIQFFIDSDRTGLVILDESRKIKAWNNAFVRYTRNLGAERTLQEVMLFTDDQAIDSLFSDLEKGRGIKGILHIWYADKKSSVSLKAHLQHVDSTVVLILEPIPTAEEEDLIEIGRLSEDLSEALRRLQKAYKTLELRNERLKDLNKNLDREIDQRKEAEEALRDANTRLSRISQRLTRSNQEKETFITSVEKSLIDPLNDIHAMTVELLELHAEDESGESDIIKKISMKTEEAVTQLSSLFKR